MSNVYVVIVVDMLEYICVYMYNYIRCIVVPVVDVVESCCPSWGVCHKYLGTNVDVVVDVVVVVVGLYADIHH